MSESMFSESWHRVATFRAWLHPSVETQRQTFRGRAWYLLRDPLSNQFFRLAPAAWFFVARLSSHKTIEQVWRECLALNADEAPGQEEVIRLLSQLTQANLLVSDLPPDSAALFERYRTTRQREQRGMMANFLFLKIPLFNPEPIIRVAHGIMRPLLNRVGFFLWLALILTAISVVFTHWNAIYQQGAGLLAPENVFLMYICATIVKLWHELGHGVLCRRFGGEVRICGVMFLILTPMPYVDVTSSWSFRYRWQRMVVGSGGMLFESFLASLAVFIWASTGHGLINSLAYNIMFLASVTTLAFNANPLLRFDGYYIFSDWLGLPNLNYRSMLQMRFVLERYIFGCIHTVSPAPTRSEALLLFGYGITSGLYRIFLIGVIALVMAEHFFAIGIVFAVFCLTLWVIVPLGKFVRYLFTDPGLERRRDFALRLTGGVFAGIILFLLLVPMPRHFRAEGVVEAGRHSVIYAQTSGDVIAVLVPSGTFVKAGTPLLQMKSARLDLEIDSAREQLVQVQAKQRAAETEAMVALQGVEGERQAAAKTLTSLLLDKSELLIAAPHDGIWICPEDLQLPGSWADRGSPLGELVDASSFYFTAVVPQVHADHLFGENIRKTEVRLRGQSGIVLPGLSTRVVPGQQDELPSAALGWKGGGDIEVMPDDTNGIHAVEPFFRVEVQLASTNNVLLAERRSGVARFTLPAEPLFYQWIRELEQILQSRLHI